MSAIERTKYSAQEYEYSNRRRETAEAIRYAKICHDVCVCPQCNGSGTVAHTLLPREVVDAITTATGVSETMLTARHAHRRIVYPRMMVTYVLRNEYNWSLPQIARAFGKHHATIMHYLTRHKDNMMVDSDYKTKADRFVNELLRGASCQE